MSKLVFDLGDKIIFAGDSVTDAGRKQPIAEAEHDWLGRGYVRVVESLLGAVYPDVPLRIVNVGTSGNNSRDLLARFERDVISQNPQWVSICIGINEVWRQFDCPAMRDHHVYPDEYRENVEKMILSVKDSVKGVFLLTPYYIEGNRQDAMRARIDEYVGICRELAEKYGCVLVDFQSMYEKFCSIRHSSSVAWDRVHPNQMGAMMMAREFLKHCDFDFARSPFEKSIKD